MADVPMSSVQPGGKQQADWMPPPPEIPGCPPGLEYLTQLDQVLLKQKVEIFEAFTGFETKNKFVMTNSMGQPMFKVKEKTGCCMRWCCGKARGFKYQVFDNQDREVMNIIRDFKCCAGCSCCANCDCCAFLVRVEAPPGNVIGYTRQMQSCWKILLDVKDAEMNTIFEVRGPCCPCGCKDVKFPFFAKDGEEELGLITKQWTGLGKEMFTDADNFGISFPIDLDVKIKASLIGTLLLLDIMAFEQENEHPASQGLGCLGDLLSILG